ncbi:MAG: histidine kinase dimerization/phospho-acceptor domain-containing protein, partial [Myxococcota bacterium]
MRYNLNTFELHDVVDCMDSIESLGSEKDSLEAFSQGLVDLLDARFHFKGQPALVLARCFITQPYRSLPDPLRSQVQHVATLDPMCLTLLATRGREPQWCDPERSTGHRVIPLFDAEHVRGIPMLARLIEQLGLPMNTVLTPSADLLLEAAETRYNVFYVPTARHSPYIPAQDHFVVPYDVRSVIGFGSVLPTGGLYVTILFTRQHVPPPTAQAFRTLALSVRLAALKLLGRTSPEQLSSDLYTNALYSAQQHLLEVFRRTVQLQSHELTERNRMLSTTQQRLEQALQDARAANVAKTEFLANMSHEIRTPMNGVLGMLELLMESRLDDQQLECVTTARRSAHALLDILNDILDFGNIK